MGSGINQLTLATFNGTSSFAADLQNAITHAVNVAGIPLNGLENDLNKVQNQQSELSTLQGNFTALQTAIQNLVSGSSGGLKATIGDNTVATVSLDSSTAIGQGTYTLNVTNAGAQTLTLSNAGAKVTDPSSTSLSTSSSFTLSVNGTNTTITPASNTLTSLAQAINSANAGVTAAVVNVGSPLSPDYRLSLQGTALNNDAIQLNDGGQPLLKTLTAGAQAQYQIDGQAVSSTTANITIAPGLTAQLLKTGQTTINVVNDPSAAENALSAFASAYNSAVNELKLNHGTGGGALTGTPIVSQLEQSLRNLLQYSGGSGSVTSLSAIGLNFDSTGKLTFNAGTFESARANSPADVASFLGSAPVSGGTGGTGFLGSATTLLTSLEDPLSGLFKTTNNGFTTQISKDTTQINSIEARIQTMQASLVQQMSLADAALSTLQSQLSMLTSLFTATRDAVNNAH